MESVNETRGQLIVLGAILVALVIVSIVVMLNGLHFTEHVTADNSAESLHAVETTEAELERNLEAIFYEVDREHEGITDRNPYATFDDLRPEVITYSRTVANTTRTGRGDVVNVTVFSEQDSGTSEPLESRTGIAVFQPRPESDGFTAADGTTDWTVVENADTVPVIRLNVEAVSGDNFALEVTDGDGDTWTLKITTSETVEITTSGSTGVTSCDPGSVDYLNVTIEGGSGYVRHDGDTACPGFKLGPELKNGPYDVRFVNSDAVSDGTFVVTGRNGGLSVAARVDDDESRQPSAFGDDESSPIVNPKYNVTYRTEEVTYDVNRTLYEEAP